MQENQITTAYWLWLRAYLIETEVRNCGSLRKARRALLLTHSKVAARMNVSGPAVLRLEAREDAGLATLRAMTEAAQAMDCEFLYFIVPKHAGEAAAPKDFSEVIWQKILPHAIEDPRVKSAQEKYKARVLAAVARELLESPEFRREQDWTKRLP